MFEKFDKYMHLPEMKGKRVVIYLVNENEQIEKSYTASFAKTARQIWYARGAFGRYCLSKYQEGVPVPLDYQNLQYEAEYNLLHFLDESEKNSIEEIDHLHAPVKCKEMYVNGEKVK